MASRRGNIFTLSPRVLLWSCATFIMLSGAVTAERQCYWCGPLADQVHRSRRAPPCESPTAHITACEPGYTHCAIVASSPPHVESRFCVKLYQDECYPLYCNSTKTWKMTCPCRGDLCNGDNTDRENQAFAILYILVARSQNNRIKKREIASTDFNSTSQDRTIIITNIADIDSNDTKEDEINETEQNDQMIVVRATARENPSTETIKNPTTSTIEQHGSTNNPVDDITTTKENEDINTNLATTSPKEISYNEIETTAQFTTIVAKPEITSSSAPDAKIKPSEQLPTAEALQQNSNPSIESTKATESMRVSTTGSTRGPGDTSTVEPTQKGGNSASKVSRDTCAFIISLTIICTRFVICH